MFKPNIYELVETQYSLQRPERDIKLVNPLLNLLLKIAERRLLRPFVMGILYHDPAAVGTIHTLGELQLFNSTTKLDGIAILNRDKITYNVNSYEFSSPFSKRPDFQETDSAEIKPLAANILYPAIHFAEPIGAITDTSVSVEADNRGRKVFQTALSTMVGTLITNGQLVRK